MSSSPRFSRGTSVIAAIVFAAILGAVALSLNALQSNSANTAALSAQAAVPYVNASGGASATPANTSQSTAQKTPTCTQVLATAISSQQNTPTRTANIPDVSGQNVDDSCNGAVLIGTNKAGYISHSIQPSGGQTQTDPTTGNIYECVGMSGKITTSSGSQSVQLNPDSSIQAGKCSLQYCEVLDQSVADGLASGGAVPSAEECYPARQYVPGTDSSAAPSTTGTVSPSVLQNTTLPAACQTDSSSAACQAALAQAGTSAPASCVTNGTCGTGWCGNGATDAPPNGTCSQCPAGTTMQSGYCQTSPGQTCPAGQTGTPPNCTSATPAAPPAAPAAAKTNSGSNLGNLGSGASLLGSFLSGLTRGLLSQPCSTTQSPYVGGTGATTLVPVQVYNPTTGTYSTSYVQQAAPTTQQPCQQQAPYGVGSNGVACSAPPAVPQCAAGATAEPTSSQGNGCTDGYQCVPTSSTLGQTPTPQISCSPQTADVGQSVAISYSCENATDSSGSGFSTNDQLSGSASTTIATPPSGTNTANFGLTCTNNGQVASAQCSVQIDQTAIDLVADPQSVQSGQTASIGWVTSGMQSCVISSPQDTNFTSQNASNTSVNGVAQTDALTQSTEYDLTCQTLGGQSTEASTIVTVGGASSTPDVTVSSTADGQTVDHGDNVTITWNASSTPADEAASIWLIDLQTEQATAVIASGEPASGTYTWQVPAVGSTCSSSSYAPCAAELVDGDSYGIEVAFYSPSSAYIGPPASEPAGSTVPTYTDYGYTQNPFTIGQ